jgi:hypothetical protein
LSGSCGSERVALPSALSIKDSFDDCPPPEDTAEITTDPHLDPLPLHPSRISQPRLPPNLSSEAIVLWFRSHSVVLSVSNDCRSALGFVTMRLVLSSAAILPWFRSHSVVLSVSNDCRSGSGLCDYATGPVKRGYRYLVSEPLCCVVSFGRLPVWLWALRLCDWSKLLTTEADAT